MKCVSLNLKGVLNKIYQLSVSQKNELKIYAETNSDEIYDNSSAERWFEKENLRGSP